MIDPVTTFLLSFSGAVGIVGIILKVMKLPPFMPVGLGLDSVEARNG